MINTFVSKQNSTLTKSHKQSSQKQRAVFEVMASAAVRKTESAYVVHPLIPRTLNYVRTVKK